MKALTHWCKLRPRSIRLTVNMKLITKSRWRENALLEAYRTVTQIQHELLLELEEDPAQYEAGRAFDVITTALCALRDNDKGKITQIISNMLYTRFKKRFDATTYPVIGTLKLGAYRRCSLMVLLWYYDVVRYLTKHNPLFASDQKSDESVPIRNSRAVYDAWSSAHATYKAACNVTIPFGYYREKRLDHVNKRDLRRLRKQLPPEKVIDQTLIHIDVLLNSDDALPSVVEQAKMARHPWRMQQKQQRRIRASYHRQPLNQRRRKVTLGLLSTAELERLERELQELRDFADIFNDVRQAIDIFLAPALPRFPTVNNVVKTRQQEEENERRYETALKWFRSPFSQHDRQSTKAVEQFYRLEQTAIQRLDEDAHLLDPAIMQPLTYTRTMRGNTGTAFALLYNPEQQRYVLALKLNPNGYPDKPPASSQDNLVFFNAPYTRFRQNSSASHPQSILLFALENGIDYHHSHMLQPVMHHQAKLQVDAYILQAWQVRTKPVTSLQTTIPASAVGELTLTHHVNAHKHHEFIAHIALPVAVPPLRDVPASIVGIHERDSQYYGAVLDIKTGVVLKHIELTLPPRLLPKPDDRAYSDNYVFELANAIVAIADQANGLIGFEDTLWKRQATSSRTANRLTFALPRQQVMDVVRYKAFLKGLAAPCNIYGVSPSQDCSVCGHRPRGSDERLSSATRGVFRCSACGIRMAAPENTATVVAQRTILLLIDRWQQSK